MELYEKWYQAKLFSPESVAILQNLFLSENQHYNGAQQKIENNF